MEIREGDVFKVDVEDAAPIRLVLDEALEPLKGDRDASDERTVRGLRLDFLPELLKVPGTASLDGVELAVLRVLVPLPLDAADILLFPFSV